MAPSFRRLSLSQKILLSLVPVFLAFTAVSVIVQNDFQEKAMEEEAQSAAHTYADIVRESLVSMMVNTLSVDSTFLDRVNMLPEIDTLRVFVNALHLRDDLLSSAREERLARKYRTLRPLDAVDSTVLRTGTPVFKREGGDVRAVVPFNATEVCRRCHVVPVGYTLGATDLHVSLRRMGQVTEGNWKRSLVIFVLFAVVVLGLGTLLFRRFVGRPVAGLMTATQAMSQGDLEHPIAGFPSATTEASRDELEGLARRFDHMRWTLKEKIDQLEEALRELRSTQEELVRSERLAATGKLMAQLSHEINNPIHNIQSLLQTSLRRVGTGADPRELLDEAIREMDRLTRLTRQMLDAYRGSASPAADSLVDLAALTAELARSYTRSLAEHHLALIVTVPSAPCVVRGSRDKLAQVIINLIINARDALEAAGRMRPGGEGTIRVAVHRDAAGIHLQVADNGVGIAPEHRHRIFDAFFTTKNEVSGVGLGLSVTYGIIQQHRGTIRVESTEGTGTTIFIDLPTGDHDTPPAT